MCMFLSIYHIDFQCQFFFLKDILGLIIFVFGGNKERKHGALNVVDAAIFSLFEKIDSYHSDMRRLLTTSPI